MLRARSHPSTQPSAPRRPFFSRGIRQQAASPFFSPVAPVQRQCADCEQERQETPLQPKLTVGQANDTYEQEADRVANQVVNSLPSAGAKTAQAKLEPNTPSITPFIMRQGNESTVAPSPQVEQGIQQSRGSGDALSPPVRQSMEQAFGADFSGVRIHANSEASQLSQSLNARAFTTGQDIYFKQGEYQPGSSQGQRLLAHELTHVIQQNGASKAIQRTHFSSEYTSWFVAPHVRRGSEAQTYSLEFQLDVAMEIALLSEAVDVSALQVLISSTLNQFGGGWRDIGGQRVYVNWTLNWVSSSLVDRGRALGVSVLPEEVFGETGPDGIFIHDGQISRILLRGGVVERVLRPQTRRERRSRQDRQERERARRRFGHEVTHEIGHALGLGHEAGTVMNASNTDRVDRHLSGEQIRQIILNLTTRPSDLPPWLRGELPTTSATSP